MARARQTAQAQGEEDVEYVGCPVCRGAGRGCRYCRGTGEVHPDDVAVISQAHAREKAKTIWLAAGAGLLGVALIVVLVLLSQRRRPDPDAGGKTKPEPVRLAPKEGLSTVVKDNPQWKGVEAIRAEMSFQLLAKNYSKVIELGESALPQCIDDIQRQNVQEMIDRAKAKMIGKK